jgi:phosphoserine aminotransferase
MKILLATEKPFAASAVEGIEKIARDGGLEVIRLEKYADKADLLKAGMLYDEIDRNPMFESVAATEDRSLMNVCFVMSKGKEELADKFMTLCNERGIVGVKGHRLVGGFRASLYNALPVGHVEYLVKVMQEFEKQNA